MLRISSELKTKRHILKNSHVGIKRVILKDHGDITVFGGDIIDQTIADPNLPVRDLLETGDHPQSGGFSTAGRPDKDEEFFILNAQIDIVNGLHAAFINFGDIPKTDLSH